MSGDQNKITNDIYRSLWLEGAWRMDSTHFIYEESVIKMGNEFPIVTQWTSGWTCSITRPPDSQAGVSSVSPERHWSSLSIGLMCTCSHLHAQVHRLRRVGLFCIFGLLLVLSNRLSESQALRRHHLCEDDSLQLSRWPQDNYRAPGPGLPLLLAQSQCLKSRGSWSSLLFLYPTAMTRKGAFKPRLS